MNRVWLYLGILLACSGVGTGFGLFLIIVYFWDDIKKSINNIGTPNNNVKEDHYKQNSYSKDTAEEMK